MATVYQAGRAGETPVLPPPNLGMPAIAQQGMNMPKNRLQTYPIVPGGMPRNV
jgi:hypothetical protein